MTFLEIIELKRDGKSLETEHLKFLVEGIVSKQIPVYQLAAFNVAVKIRGFTKWEANSLSEALKELNQSADILEISGIGIDSPLYSGNMDQSSRSYHEIIRKKIQGLQLSESDISFFIEGVASGSALDQEIAAYCMAVYINGMERYEIVSMIQSMISTGEHFIWPNKKAKYVDKHSTGGVGDKISLPLVGVLMALGLKVPMISGRGLGHTGGTLDKLQSIAGFRINLEPEEIKKQIDEIGAVMSGQTAVVVPADRRMYAIRDVTATVSSIPLITASILSKKLAEGISSLVLDVKVGSGGFMKTLQLSRELASSLTNVCHDYGVNATALLTNMSEPLGDAVGNSLEVIESINCLKGEGPEDIETLVVALAAELLYSTESVVDLAYAKKIAKQVIDDGSALACFRDIVVKQNGDDRIFDSYDYFPKASIIEYIKSDFDGILQVLDAETVGKALIVLGGGRKVQEDVIDSSVGFLIRKKIGSYLNKGDIIIEIHANDRHKCNEAIEMLRTSIKIGNNAPFAIPLIIERM